MRKPPRASRPCFVDTCPKRISIRFLMCRPHWRMVPRDLQRDVWLAVENWRLYGAHDTARELADARRAAADAVNQKIEERRSKT